MTGDGTDTTDEPGQLVVLDAQDLTDLLNDEEITSNVLTVDENGELLQSETKIVNQAGKPPWLESNTSRSSLGWKGHAYPLSTFVVASALAAYVVTRVPLEDVFVDVSVDQMPGFVTLFAVLCMTLFVVYAIPYLPGKISGGRGGH